MRAGTPFRAAAMMMAAMAAAQQMFGAGSSGYQTALSNLGPYEGRGKKRTRLHHGPGNGASISQRIAKKARNVARHKRNCRG